MKQQGTKIGNRYALEEMIGRGGIGEVYSALDTKTQNTVAVKVLKSQNVARDEQVIERFLREGEALRKLNHPNIVMIHDMLQDEGNYYIIMELLAGGSLGEWLKDHPKPPIKNILQLGLELADALTRAHHLNIVHRDIKPANVLIADDGSPRLTDFGIARFGDSHMTEQGVVMGTFAYLSPEACRGEDLDARTDIWAYGILMYEMLTGRRPYTDEQPGALLTSILNKPIPPIEDLRPDTPVALIDLIYRMLEKNKDARIPSMRMVGAEIEAIMKDLDTKARDTSSSSLFGTTNNRRDIANITPISTQHGYLPANNLPAQTTPFVGRIEELTALDQLLYNPQQRLITILGLGGTGKTRLALASALRNPELFPDGIFFVPLASVTDPKNLATTIAEDIGYSFSGQGEDLAELINFLRQKRLLLIFDNFEHLLEATPVLAEILKQASHVKMLVTSRERLRLQAENAFEITGFQIPRTKDSPEKMAQFPVVQLFMNSAQRVMANFELDEDTAPYVARICQLVDGLPLGVELAAAWLEMLTIGEITTEIERSFDFLETSLRDVPERQRSIRAIFEYSWNLMTVEERDVFMKLAVFSGGFEREAAQEIAGANLKQLMTLVNKSLLRRTPEGRYFAQEMLRDYAAERFTDLGEERDKAHRAHAKYYAKTLSELELKYSSKNERKAVEVVEKELDNVRAAWRWLVEAQCWAELDKMLTPLMYFFQSKSYLREGYDLFKDLADRVEKMPDQQTFYWRARQRQVWQSMRSGDYNETYTVAHRVLNYFTQQDDVWEMTVAMNTMSYTLMMQGQYQEAIDLSAEALRRAYELDDSGILFLSMGNLGYAMYLYGDYEGARSLYEDLKYMAEEGRFAPTAEAYAYNNLGEILHAQGHLHEALDLYNRAYAIFESFNNLRGMAFSLNNIAGINSIMGNYSQTREMYVRGYELNLQIGDRYGMGHSLSALGNVHFFSNEYAKAKEYYQQALTIRREINDQKGIADSLDDIAYVEIEQKNLGWAKQYTNESVQIRRKINDRAGLASTLIAIALLERFTGNIRSAKKPLEESLKISREMGILFNVARALAGLSEIDLLDGNMEAARAKLREALEIAQKVEGGEGVHLYFLGCVADYYFQQELYEKAFTYANLVMVSPSHGYDFAQDKSREVLALVEEKLSPEVMQAIRQSTQTLKPYDLLREFLANA